jgi:hypothetical protein
VSFASAHELARSESTLTIDGATVRARVAIDLLELQGVDRNADQRVSYEELDAAIERVFAALEDHLALRAPDPPTRVTMGRRQILDDHVLQVDLAYTFDRGVRELRVESTLDRVASPSHLHHVRANIGGETYQALLTPSSRSATFLAGGVTFGRILTVLLALLGLGAWVAHRNRVIG